VGVAEKETNSAVCFGGCLESQGVLGTDKLFTGQRLDDSGLYYYVGRYYDPTIARFISADTIVPNPSNPQTWNRYAYTLNNPLKYTDPNGHDVRIGSAYNLSFNSGITYVQELGTASADAKLLLQAWDTFKSVAPDVAKAMEAAKSEYVIGRGPQSSGGSITVGPLGNTTYIGIMKGLNDVNGIASSIAHESFHAQQGHQADSVEEEIGAFQFEDKVNQKLPGVNDPFAAQFRSFDFSLETTNHDLYRKELEKQLPLLEKASGNTGLMYNNLPLESGDLPDWIQVSMMGMNLLGNDIVTWSLNMNYVGY
jgi:RHS repeat-associated protein